MHLRQEQEADINPAHDEPAAVETSAPMDDGVSKQGTRMPLTPRSRRKAATKAKTRAWEELQDEAATAIDTRLSDMGGREISAGNTRVLAYMVGGHGGWAHRFRISPRAK